MSLVILLQKYLIKYFLSRLPQYPNKYIIMNEKKLVTLNIRGKTLEDSEKIQNDNLQSLSNCIFRIFNQINLK